MAKTINRLSSRGVSTETRPGRHADGGGLYLNVTERIAAGGSKTYARSWIFLWRSHGRRREMGLGSHLTVSLAEARDLALAARKHVHAGRDPIAERDRVSAQTFGEVADELIESLRPSWRNSKHAAQWTATLKGYAAPLRPIPVANVTTEDVLRVLKPLWSTRPETASRLRARIERVLGLAIARGTRSAANCAAWRGHLKSILPAPKKLARGHHAALPVAEVPGFMKCLRSRDGVSARALEFLVLTAARSGEARGALWSEFDLTKALWVVPGYRMKSGAEHIVPLSGRALAIVEELKPLGTDLVFPGAKRGCQLSDASLTAVLKRMKVSVTAHGFRSSFRDWAGDFTSFPRELAEHALAHRVGDETERAYRRSAAIERRRELMTAWENYCAGSAGANVIALPVAAAR